ncbi:MAG: 4Fe-4S dicluster domain-containing protein [Bacteroidota bacterium]
MAKKTPKDFTRSDFIKAFCTVGIASVAVPGIFSACTSHNSAESGEKVTLLTTDGKIVTTDKSNLESCCAPVSPAEARIGIPGKKFVMVVDLAKCRNARKCVESCEKAHHIAHDRPFIKVLKINDNKKSSPYWMPKKCFHCDNPPCVKVCPVGATFKRSDGIVLIDNERCIGCRFCMAACPYSARVFNWGAPKNPEDYHEAYSPETSTPSKIGTVEKCDFCPDKLRQGKLPHCILACPNGTLYFGDENDDVVTNGEESLRLSELLRDKAGYRYMESLGTEPRVYYLPPVERVFPFKDEENIKNA